MDIGEKTARTAWTVLRAGGNEPAGLGIPTKASSVTTSDGVVRFALGQNGEARLLLPLGTAERGSVVQGAPALDVRISVFGTAGKSQRFLDLTCPQRDLDSVFAEVAGHILASIESGTRCLDAARATIAEFRALLVRPAGSDVSREQIAGLVGELLVLKRLLDRSPDAWKSWRGPAMARHDFMRASNSLEVKVCVGKGRTRITINGLEQLSEPAGGLLFLQHFELEVAEAAMLSISSLGHAVLDAASQPDEVKMLLEAVGCQDVDDPLWNTASFRLERETLYSVADGFPRLVSSSFPGGVTPAGISDLTYTTDLAFAGPFRMGPSRAREVEDMFLP
ncbi:PD-(D/E)XK motif protein [Rhizobium laguerreae]|uniref:PD-(D/E)XK motif protein n=1 Tax=Rhizobium laguerreae TaxID=1076926 RepID=UPI001C9038C8|nr:PD-(D/E)XK motif protein [Rhizobium laguerreae]MBY3165750.1 PD-(D/E)XK motif protein [Rhizobium laguerreae]